MNVFEELAERQISAPRKARMQAAEKRALLKVAEEKRQLNKFWQKWRAEKREKLLAGPFGNEAQALIDFLRSMTPDSGDDLIAAVAAGPWIQADKETRSEILGLVDRAIIAVRERNGLPTFDDVLPWSDEEPSAFQIIHGMLV